MGLLCACCHFVTKQWKKEGWICVSLPRKNALQKKSILSNFVCPESLISINRVQNQPVQELFNPFSNMYQLFRNFPEISVWIDATE